MSGKVPAEIQRWRWHNDPDYRLRKAKSNRITKVKQQIKYHLQRIKELEQELLETTSSTKGQTHARSKRLVMGLQQE